MRKSYKVASLLDQLIVIDVEATCWDGPPPTGQEAEIIEIGVCTLEISTGRRIVRHSILVKPEKSEVSPFCTELTTLTQSQVAQGVSFEQACRILRRKFRAGDRVWASYGDYDRRQFDKQCREREILYPFGPSHINIKNLVALLHGLQREVGLLDAMRLMQLPLEGTHHRGVDDAWNTGMLLSKLILQRREAFQTSS
ncbi:MAG: exonuclease domain-containing protein [Chloroflexi bacterium]|nr:exonuclease domain-containing protein [Chloroflexota bacterium]